MFVLLGGFLSLFAFLEFAGMIRRRAIFFYLLCSIMTLMLCFRYGQGTDYHNYEIQE